MIIESKAHHLNTDEKRMIEYYKQLNFTPKIIAFSLNRPILTIQNYLLKVK